MSGLRVYDTDGTGLHPHGIDSDKHMSSYFDKLVFAMKPANDSPILETYLRVRTENGREQVSIRYVGENPSTLIQDCRKAIQRELIDQRGWEVLNPVEAGPESVFWNGIWKRDQSQQAADLFSNINVEQGDAELLQSGLKSGRIGQVHITFSSYAAVGDILPQMSETEYMITVTRPAIAPIEGSDIHFSYSQSQRQPFRLHSDTREELESWKERRQDQRRKELLNKLDGTLEELNEIGINKQELKSGLSDSLNRTFPGLIIMPKERWNKQRRKAPKQSQANNSQSSSVRSIFPIQGLKEDRILLLLALSTVVIGLAIIVFATGYAEPILDIIPVGGGESTTGNTGGGVNASSSIENSNNSTNSSINSSSGFSINNSSDITSKNKSE